MLIADIGLLVFFWTIISGVWLMFIDTVFSNIWYKFNKFGKIFITVITAIIAFPLTFFYILFWIFRTIWFLILIVFLRKEYKPNAKEYFCF